MKAVKKKAPGFSQPKAKQFDLWGRETRRAEQLPAANHYNPIDSQVTGSRFNNIHMGTDKKVCAKDIGLTPGPGEYIRVDEQYPRTFNHAAKHGRNNQDIFKTFGQPNVPLKAF